MDRPVCCQCSSTNSNKQHWGDIPPNSARKWDKVILSSHVDGHDHSKLRSCKPFVKGQCWNNRTTNVKRVVNFSNSWSSKYIYINKHGRKMTLRHSAAHGNPSKSAPEISMKSPKPLKRSILRGSLHSCQKPLDHILITNLTSCNISYIKICYNMFSGFIMFRRKPYLVRRFSWGSLEILPSCQRSPAEATGPWPPLVPFWLPMTPVPQLSWWEHAGNAQCSLLNMWVFCSFEYMFSL